ncbi:MAG: TetR family transcriptional regulator [Planctomycetes bacterium]|nr:TetR family transcriptional regulator [Planctomycetota bacterium]
MRLVERSGPFLSMPVLLDVFPQGLGKDDRDRRADLRDMYENWVVNNRDIAVHRGWINYVLSTGLEIPDSHIVDTGHIPQELHVRVPMQHETLQPDFAVLEPSDDGSESKPRMIVMVVPPTQSLDKPLPNKIWHASPHTRMSDLVRGCNNSGIFFGLVTNGEQWTLVYSKQGETASFTTWYASIWFDEPITLRSFLELLSAKRLYGDPNATLEKLFERSSEHQSEVTDQLGLQVRDALETLVEAIDRIDRDLSGKLLKGFSEEQLYEACVTVMMRLVFLFFAEERRLLPVKEFFYEQSYSLQALVEQLRSEKNVGEELLEYRYAAWSRLLALFRAIHGGVQHDDMQMPAYSGSLFDPDRFPFLEGRSQRSKWLEEEAKPLPINDRTILHILEALQYLEVKGVSKGERVMRRLSFQELDVEQIGHIYESLLDHTTKRADGHVLGLAGTKGQEPEIALATLEAKAKQGREALVEFLMEETGKSASVLNKLLDKECEFNEAVMLGTCGNDQKLFGRVMPFANLLRTNRSNDPVIIPDGSMYVTEGTSRRSTGTHYTPKVLTEPVVQYSLEPLVYEGPAEGKSEDDWKLLPAERLLELKICDMACGSGAFLVQACRYLSERLVQAWTNSDSQLALNNAVGGDLGQYYQTKWVRSRTGETAYNEPDFSSETDIWFPLPSDHFERLTIARRMIAQRCLYGVDKNRLAVEMCKLSLWLLTLAKEKPFTFVDHAIRCGDSLVGISDFEQLMRFSFNDNHEKRPLIEQQREQIKRRIDATLMLRRQIEVAPSNSPRDIERKSVMLKTAEQQTRRLTYAADLLLSGSWQPMSDGEREAALDSLLSKAVYNFRDNSVEELDREAKNKLANSGVGERFHWPLEFPEVYVQGGFDLFIGNPPFMGGRKISSNFGEEYERYLKGAILEGKKGSVNLVLYFMIRASQAVKETGTLGFVATDSIRESDSREIGMSALFSRITPYWAISSRPWPGDAGVYFAIVIGSRGRWLGSKNLDGTKVEHISTMLEGYEELPEPFQLKNNSSFCSDGVKVQGIGFVVDEKEAFAIIEADPKNREVLTRYIVGDDLNHHPEQLSNRWVVNFWNRPESECREYIQPWKIVCDRVKSYRDGLTKQVHEACFWKFWDRREAFFNRVRTKGSVFVCSKLSKHLVIGKGNPNYIYSEKVKVFDFSSASVFGLLQSNIHSSWVLHWGSSTGETPAYVGSRCFDTFPFPTCLIDSSGKPVSNATIEPLETLGNEYLSTRTAFAREKKLGMTDLYNLFHSEETKLPALDELRTLQIEMDRAVLEAYGWTQLNLAHGFHETPDGVRFTVSASARRSIVQLLLKLNHERYSAESAAKLHEKKVNGPMRHRRSGISRSASLPGFGDQEKDG